MSLIALGGGKGAPGVTTTALALGAVWPREVLVTECDTAGGSIATHWQLASTRGLIDIAGAQQLTPEVLNEQIQTINGGLRVLTGILHPEQEGAVHRLWSKLGATLSSLPGDVLADFGRLGPGQPNVELLRAADVIVLIVRPDATGLQSATGRLRALRNLQTSARIGLVCVGSKPWSPQELASAANAELFGSLPNDCEAAGALLGLGSSRLERSKLLGAARELAAHLGEIAKPSLAPVVALDTEVPKRPSVVDA